MKYGKQQYRRHCSLIAQKCQVGGTYLLNDNLRGIGICGLLCSACWSSGLLNLLELQTSVAASCNLNDTACLLLLCSLNVQLLVHAPPSLCPNELCGLLPLVVQAIDLGAGEDNHLSTPGNETGALSRVDPAQVDAHCVSRCDGEETSASLRSA